MDAIANFAQGHTGQTYAAVCRDFGIDPAQGIDDPFLAYQLRAALALVPAESTDEQIGEDHRARVEQARQEAARLRSM